MSSASEESQDSISKEAQEADKVVPAIRGVVKRMCKKPGATDVPGQQVQARPKASPTNIKMVKRTSPPEAYLAKDGKHLIGLSAKRSADYIDILNTLAGEAETQDLSKVSAKVRLEELLAEQSQ